MGRCGADQPQGGVAPANTGWSRVTKGQAGRSREPAVSGVASPPEGGTQAGDPARSTGWGKSKANRIPKLDRLALLTVRPGYSQDPHAGSNGDWGVSMRRRLLLPSVLAAAVAATGLVAGLTLSGGPASRGTLPRAASIALARYASLNPPRNVVSEVPSTLPPSGVSVVQDEQLLMILRKPPAGTHSAVPRSQALATDPGLSVTVPGRTVSAVLSSLTIPGTTTLAAPQKVENILAWVVTRRAPALTAPPPSCRTDPIMCHPPSESSDFINATTGRFLMGISW